MNRFILPYGKEKEFDGSLSVPSGISVELYNGEYGDSPLSLCVFNEGRMESDPEIFCSKVRSLNIKLLYLKNMRNNRYVTPYTDEEEEWDNDYDILTDIHLPDNITDLSIETRSFKCNFHSKSLKVINLNNTIFRDVSYQDGWLKGISSTSGLDNIYLNIEAGEDLEELHINRSWGRNNDILSNFVNLRSISIPYSIVDDINCPKLQTLNLSIYDVGDIFFNPKIAGNIEKIHKSLYRLKELTTLSYLAFDEDDIEKPPSLKELNIDYSLIQSLYNPNVIYRKVYRSSNGLYQTTHLSVRIEKESDIEAIYDNHKDIRELIVELTGNKLRHMDMNRFTKLNKLSIICDVDDIPYRIISNSLIELEIVIDDSEYIYESRCLHRHNTFDSFETIDMPNVTHMTLVGYNVNGILQLTKNMSRLRSIGLRIDNETINIDEYSWSDTLSEINIGYEEDLINSLIKLPSINKITIDGMHIDYLSIDLLNKLPDIYHFKNTRIDFLESDISKYVNLMLEPKVRNNLDLFNLVKYTSNLHN